MRILSRIFLVSQVLAAACILHAQPKIEFVEGTKVDLGTIYRGTTAEKKLTIRNVGTKTLEVGKVEVSCGCTGTLLSSDHLKPGETGTLLITFNSKNFKGPVHKTVTVNSNAKDSPRTSITFTASVVEEITLSESRFMFKNAEVGLQSTASITVTNNANEKLRLTGYKTELPGFSLKLPSEPIEPGQTVQLVAEYKPEQAARVLSKALSIETSSKRQPELSVYIFGNVKEWKFE
jgi:hypothetical protein